MKLSPLVISLFALLNLKASDLLTFCEIEFPSRIDRVGGAVSTVAHYPEGEDDKNWTRFVIVGTDSEHSFSEFKDWLREGYERASKDQFPGLNYGKPRAIDLVIFSESEIASVNGKVSTFIEIVFFDRKTETNQWYLYLLDPTEYGLKYWIYGDKNLQKWDVDSLFLTPIPNSQMSDFKECFLKESRKLKLK